MMLPPDRPQTADTAVAKLLTGGVASLGFRSGRQVAARSHLGVLKSQPAHKGER